MPRRAAYSTTSTAQTGADEAGQDKTGSEEISETFQGDMSQDHVPLDVFENRL
jgi:hypothetical protein